MQPTRSKPWDWKFITGTLVLFLFSAVIGSLNIGIFYLLGIPLLGVPIGLSLVWLSGASRTSKALVSLLWLPLVVVSFFVSIYLRSADSETILIPSDYRGPITVFLNEPCGNEPELEQGRRVYKIDPEGIAIVKFPENHGLLNRKFYLVGVDGTREEIPKFGRQNFDTELQEWGVRNKKFGPLTKETVGVFEWYGAKTYYTSKESISLIVSDYSLWDMDEKTQSVQLEHWADEAVEQLKQCRRRHK